MIGLTVSTFPMYQQQMPGIWSAHSFSLTQGPDAEQREAQAIKAVAHWWERPTLVMLVAESEDFSYNHVPLLPNRTIKTRYRYVGRLAPREYPLDND